MCTPSSLLLGRSARGCRLRRRLHQAATFTHGCRLECWARAGGSGPLPHRGAACGPEVSRVLRPAPWAQASSGELKQGVPAVGGGGSPGKQMRSRRRRRWRRREASRAQETWPPLGRERPLQGRERARQCRRAPRVLTLRALGSSPPSAGPRGALLRAQGAGLLRACESEAAMSRHPQARSTQACWGASAAAGAAAPPRSGLRFRPGAQEVWLDCCRGCGSLPALCSDPFPPPHYRQLRSAEWRFWNFRTCLGGVSGLRGRIRLFRCARLCLSVTVLFRGLKASWGAAAG